MKKGILATTIIIVMTTILCVHAQEPEWKFNFGKNSMSPQVAVNKYVYIGNEEGVLYALETGRGKQVWSFNAGSAILHTPLVADKRVYIATKNGDVYALDAENGNMQWKQSFRQKFQSAPAMSGEFLILCSRDHIYGLDKQVGIDLWQAEIKTSGSPEIHIINNKAYFSDDMTIYAFDCENGQSLWKYQVNVFGISDLFCSEEYAYFISANRIICLNLTDGSEKWKKKLEYPSKPRYYNAPALINNLLIVSYLSDVIAFDPQKGTEIWKHNTKASNELYTAALVQNMIWVAERGNTVYTLSADKGKKGKSLNIDEVIHSKPLFDKTKFFYSNAEGFLISVRIQ